MPLLGVVLGVAALLLLVAVAAVVLTGVRRSRGAAAGIEARGWKRLPDGPDAVLGWEGWPFVVAKRQGSATDVVVGDVAGVEFMSLRWSQSERDHGGSEVQGYNVVAVRCEVPLPHLTVVRGAHRVTVGEMGVSTSEVESGDDRFDGRWQVLGDATLARDLLVPEVREVIDGTDSGAWVMQPGWATRVVASSFMAGEDAMLEELHRAAAPWLAVPTDVWRSRGGVPRFVAAFDHGRSGRRRPTTD